MRFIAALRYIFTSGFVDDVIFPYKLHMRIRRENEAHAASESPGGSTGATYDDYDCLVLVLITDVMFCVDASQNMT